MKVKSENLVANKKLKKVVMLNIYKKLELKKEFLLIIIKFGRCNLSKILLASLNILLGIFINL